MVNLYKIAIIDGESEAYMMNEAKPVIPELLEEHSFLSLRSIQMMSESKKYWHTVAWNAIRELAKEEELRTAKYPPRGMFPVRL